MQLIVAEKPSVARDLARVLGVPAVGRTHYQGNGRVITWCVGHLVELEEPAAYDPRWKHWRLDTLPMLPPRFKLRPATGAAEQYRAVRDLLRDKRFDEVVNACDAGREGELIFRYVYELAGSRLPIRRLWISSLTDEAIRQGMSTLRPGSAFDALADAARCRSEADWLVGMNATRAVTTRSRRGTDGTLYSIGRVQTPTLALLVSREKAIRDFVPTSYWEVRGAFATAAGERFAATWTHARATRLARAELAQTVVDRDRAHGRASDPAGPRVASVKTKTVREAPPLLFDLTSLQRTANRRFGFSAARTLDLAQSLYEKHKVLTYPRTDSRHLSTAVAKELPRLFTALEGVNDYATFARHLLASPPRITRRIVDDSKVQDHHAIIPTGKPVKLESLDPDERKIFDLVARRFLAVFYPDAEFASTELVVRVGPGEPTPDASPSRGAEAAEREGSENTSTRDDDPSERLLDALPPFPDHFVARGRVRLVAGWQEVAGLSGDDETPARAGAAGDRSPAREAEPEQSLPKLREGDRLEGSFEPLAKQTRPPSRYTEATLLGAMESAGKAIEDEALRQAMKDCGLGTPATRAAIIETLLKRGYVSRDKKHVVPTPLGMALIDALPVQSLASPELTGSWEARLARIARGEDSRDAFMADIAAFVREVVEAIRGAAPPSASSVTPEPGPRVGRCPRCGGDVVERVRDYACAVGARPCGFSLPKLIARRAISPALASVLLGQKRTQVLRGFKSKQGRSFAAALVLDEGGEVRFVFAYGGEPTISPPDSSHEAPASPPPAPPPPRPRATAARVAKPSARPRASEPAPPAADLAGLVCPRCKQGALVTGKRGWGCARWREGCGFVVWFETAGRRITATQLRELIEKGRTRKGRWTPGNGPPVPGHLVLDVTAQGGAVRFEPAAPPRSRVNR